jgi:IS5 family transposase
LIRRRDAQLTIAEVVLFGMVVPRAEDLMDDIVRDADRVLQDEALVDEVLETLRRRYPQSARRGRYGTPAEVVLRLLVLKHLRQWSYAQLVREVAGSIVYRRFCRVEAGKVPDDKTLVKLGKVLAGPALRRIFDRIVELGVERGVSGGRRMRLDTTVTEAAIRFPTDSRLCEDVIRVLSRALRRVADAGIKLSVRQRDVSRSMSHRLREIAEATRMRRDERQEARRKAYRGLLRLTARLTRHATRVLDDIRDQFETIKPAAQRKVAQQRAYLEAMLPRARQVVRQTRARILREVTDFPGKIVSIFEPSARIIRKGKAHRPTEFGSLVKVQESDGGLVTDIGVVDGTADQPLLVPGVKRHIEVFGRAPGVVATDRGFFSEEGERQLKELGVRNPVTPKPGHRSTERKAYERRRCFRRGRAWRAGGEGRISFLKRSFGMSRSRYRGPQGIERTTLWAGVAHNLVVVARRSRC